MSARRIFTRPARLAAIAPYVWMVLFFLVPFGFVLKISLSQTAIAQPPYLPVFDLTQGFAAVKAAFAALSLDNFRLLVSDDLYVLSYLRSLVVAAVSTSILLLIGYPIAYGMARLPQALAAGRDDARHRSLLDLVFDPHLCLDQHPAARRPAQQDPAGAASGLGAGGVALHRQRDVSRHRLFLSAVHDPPALCDARQNGAGAAGGGSRSRLFAAAGVLAGDLSAVIAGRRRGRVVVLHPDRRRIRDSRSARGFQFADDRPDPVA